MKSTGIVRNVDSLNRVVIPIELCRTFGIRNGDPLEVYVDGDKIILKQYRPGCVFCGQVDGAINFRGKNICPDCIKKISKSDPSDVETAIQKSIVGGKK